MAWILQLGDPRPDVTIRLTALLVGEMVQEGVRVVEAEKVRNNDQHSSKSFDPEPSVFLHVKYDVVRKALPVSFLFGLAVALLEAGVAILIRSQ